MAYTCRHCGDKFARGTAFKSHLQVHAPAPGQQARTRFPGSEPYDAAEYPARAVHPADEDGGAGAGGGSHDADDGADTVPLGVSVEEELRLRLCELKANGAAGTGLSEADMSNILRIVALAGRADTSQLYNSCDELSRELLTLVARHPEFKWYVAEVAAPSFPDAPRAKVIYRRLQDTLTSAVRTLDVKWGFWDPEVTQAGDRIYNHPCSGLLFEAVCGLLRDTGAEALPLHFWSDKANLTKRGNKSYYPLSCVVLPVSFDQYREQWPDSTVAFLPIVERSDLPSSMTDREFMLYKAEIEAECLERVLFPVCDAGHVIRCTDKRGVERDVLAFALSWIADFMEQLALAGLIGHTGCALCDASGAELLPNPDAIIASAPRTAETIETAIASMRAAWDAGLVGDFDRVRSEARQLGAPPILLTLFQRGLLGKVFEARLLPALVPASVMPADALHVFDEGWGKRLVKMIIAHAARLHGKATAGWIADTLALRMAMALEMAFIEETKWPDPWRVFRGRKGQKEGCSGLQACEMRAVMQLIVCILPGILGSKGTDGTWRACRPEDDYVTDVWVAFVHYYMELKRYNRPHGHTERTLQMLVHLGERFLRVLRQHFLQDQTSGFATPKAHQGFGPHVPDTIRLLGSPQWLSSEWGENSVKSGHAAYEATNKSNANAEEQMAVHMAKRAASRQALAAAGLSVKPVGLGQRRTARREAEKTGVNTLASETVARVSVTDFSSYPLPAALVDRPGMTAFTAELARFLRSENKADMPYVDIVNSAALVAKLAHNPDEYAATVNMTVYAAPSFRRRRRFSFVALEGANLNTGAPEEWIAQLLLLFRLPDGTQLAYVQFLVVDTERAGEGPLFGTPSCAPLVWERVGARARYSYAVTHLDKIIRREFVVPDLSTLFAPRRLRQRRQAARAKRESRRWRDSESEESSGNASSSDSKAEADNENDPDSEEDGSADDVATEAADDGAEKRWPSWIRNPFVWGW